ncbi:MAG: D-glycero-beta-D-manno-heptose 1-phosphate adenylyltransferase [Bacteroidota bacterium]
MPAPILELVNDKIMSLSDMYNRRNSWRPYDQLTVFTNGVFDVIHPGHLTYLAEARSLGDRLIVGLNSDASVKRLKGDERPIMPQSARAQLLASLFFVDGVVLFEEDTPLQLITRLQPDILVKGGDYSEDEIVGAREVKAAGGQVKVLSFLDGFSSTSIIQKIKNLGWH